MSMSANRAWRKRLFLLRHNCIDYYEHNNSSITITPATNLASATSTDSSASSSAPSTPALSSSYSSSLTGSLRGTIPLDPTTLVRVVDYDDVRFGFEIVTRDKEARLHAMSSEERDEWIEEIKKAMYRIRRSAGMADADIERLEDMQEKADSIDSNHPSRAVEL